jgi:DNA-binding transcriptional LysR family regulator
MDRLSGLEVFVQTAERESFVAAGRALGISASAVSKSISRLEDRVAVRLFQRSTRSVRLTSEGQVFLERCRRIMGEVEAAENELSAMNQRPRGRLKVGLPLAAGLPLPVISDFMERYREIEGTPAKPSDLVNHACLHYRYPTSGKLEEWPMRQSRSGAAAVALPMTMVASSLIALLYLVQDGRGIACVPDFAVKDALADGRLESVLDSYMTRSVVFHILWPSSKRMTPKVRAFVDFVVERFGTELVTSAIGQRRD